MSFGTCKRMESFQWHCSVLSQRDRGTCAMAVMKLCDGASDCLVLEDREGINWCGCTLVTAKGTRYLGAESWRYVMVHLLEALNGHGKSAGRIEGDDVRWALSLAEEHCSLYVADREDRTKVFYWQDRSGLLIHAMRHSPNDMKAWNDELQRSETTS